MRGLELGLARDLTARCEQLGYNSLWSNDEPNAPGLETLGRLRPGSTPSARAVDELRGLLPEGTRIVVAAMRPRLCRVGGAIADGVLLNWMLPGQAEEARRWVE